MNTDAQEAAMGLLSLSPSNLAAGQGPGSVVPLKRKLATGMRKRPSSSSKTGPRLVTFGEAREDVSQETIRCICGLTHDDGFSIACDDCSRWCHGACFGIDAGHVPEEWKCWLCVARGPHGRKRRRLSGAHAGDEGDVVVDIETDTHVALAAHANIVPAAQTRTQLVRAAQDWRGVCALTPYAGQTQLQPSPGPSLAAPRGYALHTTAALAKETLITPLTSTITPSAAYVCDPLNAYAHLGLPKPFVHLIGPPLDVALDARMAGDDGRWVRSGCRPNAVLRPVLCPAPGPPTTLGFAVFAARDLRKGEEVVLGWEWDDGHAIHLLPALLESPGLFPPAHKAHLRAQMANILHLLSSTFPACACGEHASDCALRAMERFVKAGADVHPTRPPDLGPLVGRTRGFRSRERVPGSGGLGGIEMCDDRGEGPSRITLDAMRRREETEDVDARTPTQYSYQYQDGRGRERERTRSPEEKMPPKMRKRWIHRAGEALKREAGRDEDKGAFVCRPHPPR
ncbi:hypothetical protein C0993_001714 [Termitomyces sp. T159_Od127]|nr:hypothetical protein C0993_001714 [Termitomyces sp. T159_Od127]